LLLLERVLSMHYARDLIHFLITRLSYFYSSLLLILFSVTENWVILLSVGLSSYGYT